MSTAEVSLDVARELRAICGDDKTRERPAGGVYVSPATAEEVAAIVRLANERRLSVGAAGGSTERGAVELNTDIVLHTAQLTEVEHYDHADLTVGVGAGMTVAQLNDVVGADNLMFGADPPLQERCTIGGLLSTAAHGPLRHGYGAVRDYCIGVRFVTGDGRRAKGGGRVVKNVAGYDLMKLLIGSYGTLAVITSASFKLFPRPRQTRTFLGEFAKANEAIAFRDRVVRSPLAPMCLELVSAGARKMMRPEMDEDAWVVCVRAAGSDAVLGRYRKELGTAISREVDGEGERTMWKVLGDFPRAMSGAGNIGPDVTLQVTGPPSETLAIVETVQTTAAESGAEVGMIGRAGVGHVQVTIRGVSQNLAEQVRTIVERLGQLRNGLSVKAVGAQNPWPVRPASLESMRAVKRALDPNNILRGREIA